MSCKKTSSSVSASSTVSTVPTDDIMKKILFTTGKSTQFGEVTVSDAKSPGGSRSTLLFSSPMIAPTGEKVVVEAWGKDAEKVDDFFK